jgi:hypothetical protein
MTRLSAVRKRVRVGTCHVPKSQHARWKSMGRPLSHKYRYFEVKPEGGDWEEVRLGLRRDTFDSELREVQPSELLSTCDRCDVLLLGGSKYCSRACYMAAYRTRHPKLKVEHKNIHCGNCGHWFMPQRSTAKFCSDRCRVAASRAKSVKNKSTKKMRVRAK